MLTITDALLNSLWLGLALTSLVWFALRHQSRLSAATRLAIWQLTGLIVIALPLLLVVPLPHPEPTIPTPTTAPTTAIETPLAPAPPITTAPLVEISDHNAFPILASTAASLALIGLLRLAIAFWVVRRIKRNSTLLNVAPPAVLDRDTRIMVHPRLAMPIAVGYRHPAIILPQRLLASLTPTEIENVVLHEAGHLARRDDWHGLLERFFRALFFIQPALWWIGRQIEHERELACDDWVVAHLGDTKPYASALARVAELGTAGWIPALGTGTGRRKEIFARMESLLDDTRNRFPGISAPLVLSAGLLLVFIITQSAPFNRLLAYTDYDHRMVMNDGTNHFEFARRGDLILDAGETEIATLSPAGRLKIERRLNGLTQRIEIESDASGTLTRRYFVNGLAQPFSAEARSFLTRELSLWAKHQTTGLRERLSRWLATGGPELVLREIEPIINGEAKREYLDALLRDTPLTPSQARRVIRLVTHLDSDEDRAQLFSLALRKHTDPLVRAAIYDGIPRIHDEDRRLTLIESAIFDQGLAAAPLHLISTLHNEDHRLHVLERLDSNLTTPLPDAYFALVHELHNEDHRQRLLLRIIEHHPDARLHVEREAAQLHSQELRRDVEVALAKNGPR
jgi:beta-lactamase regulating signal transducer with metallopeptidase domain